MTIGNDTTLRGTDRVNDRLTVVNRPEAGRYELLLADEVVGHAIYSVADDTIVIAHVETRPDHRGKDFAARLMTGLLDDVRAQARRVRPMCRYAATHIRRHPETHDVLDTDRKGD